MLHLLLRRILAFFFPRTCDVREKSSFREKVKLVLVKGI